MSASNGKVPPNRKLYVQQSADGKTGWKSLGWFTTKSDGTFNLDGYVSVPKGYWRLYSAGSSDYQPGYSNSGTSNHRHPDHRLQRRSRAGPAGATPSHPHHRHLAAAERHEVGGIRQAARLHPLPGQGQDVLDTAGLRQGRLARPLHRPLHREAGRHLVWVYLASGSYVDAESYHDYVDVR